MKLFKLFAGTRGKSLNLVDIVFKAVCLFCAFLLVVLAISIFFELIVRSWLSIKTFGIGFLFSEDWNPVVKKFGAASSIYGTMITTIIAMLIAVPLGFVIALFLVELAHPTVSKIIGTSIEMLAAVPSIIYGMWGLFVFAPFMSVHIQPFLKQYFGFLPIFRGPTIGIGMLSAGVILALMILPFITSVTRDVFTMMPAVLKESAYGLGSTTWEAVSKISIRYGIAGIIGACFLGLGRALGETMAVTFIIGNKHKISTSLFDAGNSIASTLANEFAEADDPIHLSALLELGLILFLITVVVQVIARLWVRKMQVSMGRK